MKQVEKTVFLSYRRTNAPWALVIYQSLTHHGYDVFFDFLGIASGDFERIILANIKARAHFLVLLTPSALERCGDPSDWLRREIETALDNERNIVPLMLEGFDFTTPAIACHLTGKLASLKRYNALSVPVDYFDAAMVRLREVFLSIPLDSVLHPTSATARQAAKDEQTAASRASPVRQQELSAQEWFEQGINAADGDESMRCFTEAIRLSPDAFGAYHNRGIMRYAKFDFEGALQDFGEAIRLYPDYAEGYYRRGLARSVNGDLQGALQDFEEAIRLKPDYAVAYYGRGIARSDNGDLEGALQDYDDAIRLSPDDAELYITRSNVRRDSGDLEGALQDYSDVIRLKPDDAEAYKTRALLYETKDHYAAAVADLQRYLDLRGVWGLGDRKTKKRIRRLTKRDTEERIRRLNKSLNK